MYELVMEQCQGIKECERKYNHYCLKERAFLIKVVLIGACGVGKSSLICQFCHGLFYQRFCVLGLNFTTRTMNIDGTDVRFYVHDTGGAERFRAVSRSYYREAVGFLLVYDITQRKSFAQAQYWLKEIRENASGAFAIILVGNKLDRLHERVVSFEEAAVFAGENGLSFIETSAESAINVDAAFEILFKEIHCPKDDRDLSIIPPPRAIIPTSRADDKCWMKWLCCTTVVLILSVLFVI